MKRKLMLILAVVALVAAACGGGDDDGSSDGTDAPAAPTVPGSAAEGEVLYDGTCIACHGDDGVGIDGLGKPLADSDFISGMSDSELVEFIAVGRDTSDPENTSGVAMPPKGGNPALTEADLNSIVAYLRTLN